MANLMVSFNFTPDPPYAQGIIMIGPTLFFSAIFGVVLETSVGFNIIPTRHDRISKA